MNSRADAHRIEGREALVAVIIELLAQARQRVRLLCRRIVSRQLLRRLPTRFRRAGCAFPN